MTNISEQAKNPQINQQELEKQGIQSSTVRDKSQNTQNQSSFMIQSDQNASSNRRKKRRSRIKRSKENRHLELTERRIAELDILYRHRLADSDVFRVTLNGSDQQILRELRRLWDEGYIDRPIEQWIMHKKYQGGRGRNEIIYSLSNKGMDVLKDRGYPAPKTALDRKNKEMGETTIFHDLTLTKLWAGLKAALDQKRERTKENYNLVFWYQDRADREMLKTEISLSSEKKINIVPDACFKLQCPISQYLFLVEYYRTRKGGNQNYLNHLKLYNNYFYQKKFQKYRVAKGFRLITLVPTQKIAENLINLINKGEKNKPLRHFRFWFVGEDQYRLYKKEKINDNNYRKILDVESILTPIFRTPIDENWHSLEE